MIRKKVLFKTTIITMCLLILPLILSGCGTEETDDPMADITSYKQLNDPQYRIGAVNGTIHGPIVEEKMPKAQLYYFNTMTDLFTAVQMGKVDAISEDDCSLIYYNTQNGNKLRIFDGYLQPFELAIAFPKTDEGKEMCGKLSEYIKKIKDDGTLEKIEKNWLSKEGSAEMTVDYTKLPAPNGVLRMATTSTSPPFSYMQNNVVVGYDLDIVSRFCEENGYGLEVMTMSFDGIIPAISSGKCDLAGNQIGITEERKESVEFTEPYYYGGAAVAVYDPNAADAGGFLTKLKESLYKTFAREQRYKLFLSGILTTLLITILSALFGTVIGFLVFMACRKGNRIANGMTRFCIWIIRGLPVVVLLMILYYIVFSGLRVSEIFVPVVAFSITFGAAVYGMLTSSVGAIDRGQAEAARALGFTDLQTLFGIVMPQALTFFLPAYKAELVSLIKATAVVGYIAVQDLTRVGDIVRSRTYEAFFPLISVAIIYFILAGILIFVINRVELKIDPKRRKREDVLKGIRIND